MAHDIFISYCNRDEAKARFVQRILEDNGYECWIAPSGIKGGDVWTDKLRDAIAASRLMVVLISGASAKSRHIPRELQLADQGRIPLLPVRIEPVEIPKNIEYLLTGVEHIDFDSRELVEAVDLKLHTRRRVPINIPPAEVPQAEPGEAGDDPYAVQKLYVVSKPSSPLHFVRECPSIRRSQFEILDVARDGDLLMHVLGLRRPPCIQCLRKFRERREGHGTLIFEVYQFEAHVDRLVDIREGLMGIGARETVVPLNTIREIVPRKFASAFTGSAIIGFKHDSGEFDVSFRNNEERDAALDILGPLLT
jgi:hypothetical protein